MDDLILRSAYLTREDDEIVRELSKRLRIPKSDIIQAAIRLRLDDWRGSGNTDLVRADLAAVHKQKKQRRKKRPAEPQEDKLEYSQEDLDATTQSDDENVVKLLTVALITTAVLIGIGIAGHFLGRHLWGESE